MEDKIAELLELAEEADRRVDASDLETISEGVAWRLNAAHLRGQIVGIRWAREQARLTPSTRW